MSKCDRCGQEMVWKGSMMDGGLTCPGWPHDKGGFVEGNGQGDNYTFVSDFNMENMPQEYTVDKKYTENWSSQQTKMVEVVTKAGNTTIFRHYRLTGQAVIDHDDFEACFDHGCQCATSHAPCSWCEHPGNPHGFDNRPDVKGL